MAVWCTVSVLNQRLDAQMQARYLRNQRNNAIGNSNNGQGNTSSNNSTENRTSEPSTNTGNSTSTTSTNAQTRQTQNESHLSCFSMTFKFPHPEPVEICLINWSLFIDFFKALYATIFLLTILLPDTFKPVLAENYEGKRFLQFVLVYIVLLVFIFLNTYTLISNRTMYTFYTHLQLLRKYIVNNIVIILIQLLLYSLMKQCGTEDATSQFFSNYMLCIAVLDLFIVYHYVRYEYSIAKSLSSCPSPGFPV